MNIAYYPGCSLHSMAREYDSTSRLVCNHLGIALKEIDNWNCCGAIAAHSLNHMLSISLSARNLALVSKMELKHVTTPCPGCYNRLKTASREIKNNQKLAEEIETVIYAPAPLQPEVLSLVQLLFEIKGLNAIKRKVVKPLETLKLAAYYGCFLTRPREITEFDDPEQPLSLDLILQALGAETVTWSHKAECCGGGFAASESSIVVDLGGQVLEAARQAGAEALVVACPLCQTNLDTRQKAIEADRRIKYNLPIIYLTQLMALAFGYPASRLGFRKSLVSPLPLLKRKKLV